MVGDLGIATDLGKFKRACRDTERDTRPFKQEYFFLPCDLELDFKEPLCELDAPIVCDAISKDKQWWLIELISPHRLLRTLAEVALVITLGLAASRWEDNLLETDSSWGRVDRHWAIPRVMMARPFQCR